MKKSFMFIFTKIIERTNSKILLQKVILNYFNMMAYLSSGNSFKISSKSATLSTTLYTLAPAAPCLI